MLKDEVSGVEAHVAARVEIAAARCPQYILIGATEAAIGDTFATKIDDAKRLKDVLHGNLPWPTYFALIRQMLIGCTKGECFYDRTITPEIETSLRELIIAFDGELRVGPQEAVSLTPEPITKAEIHETLGWDKVETSVEA